MTKQRVSVIEVSSRATRLLVADITDYAVLEKVHTSREFIDLRALLSLKKDERNACSRELVMTIKIFVSAARRCGATETRVFGTHALRQLKERYEEDCAQPSDCLSQITIVDVETEALLALVGALKSLNVAPSENIRTLVIDQGGGSTEVAIGALCDGRIHLEEYYSLGLGIHRTVDTIFKNNGNIRATRYELEACVNDLSLRDFRRIERVVVLGSAIKDFVWHSLYGYIKFHDQKIHAKVIDVQMLSRFLQKIENHPSLHNKLIRKKEPHNDKSVILVSGAIVHSILLKKCKLKRILVGTQGARFGMAWVAACADLICDKAKQKLCQPTR